MIKFHSWQDFQQKCITGNVFEFVLFFIQDYNCVGMRERERERERERAPM